MLYPMPASPTLPNETVGVQITLRITRAQRDFLQRVAEVEDRTISSQLRHLIATFQREREA